MQRPALLRRLTAFTAGLVLAAAGAAATAEPLSFEPLLRMTRATTSTPVLRSWMNPEIATAWQQGFTGTGTTITVIDDFTSGSRLRGNLGTGVKRLRHGEWTRTEAGMIAPGATMRWQDFNKGTAISLGAGLNTLNLSYGMYATAGYSAAQIGWSAQESSIIAHARNGTAVVVKAAGNDSVAVGSATAAGSMDYLNQALIGAQATIFVGALSANGSVSQPASLASYSNYAGSNPTVQAQFLTVGVTGNTTGLYGTSFAAPVVTGYSAVLGSKFRTASPAQIANQLLTTARTDTIRSFDPALHGRGEASIARALAPIAIN